MPIVQSEFPILEYDSAQEGVIPINRHGFGPFPSTCLLCFFAAELEALVSAHEGRVIAHYQSEMGNFPVYAFSYNGAVLCAVRALVGSASIATMADFLIGHGVQNIIACGACGVLAGIPAGEVIVPVLALRDEGASYHYLPPSRTVAPDAGITATIRRVLAAHRVPFVEAMTWTTDGFFRETADMIQHRMQEGCQVVEMECATLAAVAQFRGARFGQLLYSGDLLTDPDGYAERAWMANHSARERLLSLAASVAAQLANEDEVGTKA